jgi:FtsZ-binding cell division protein ZapB
MDNLADISIFESLQSNQHDKVGMTQMAVFNDLASVKSAVDAYNKVQREVAKLGEATKQVTEQSAQVYATLQSELKKENARIKAITDMAVREKEKQQFKSVVFGLDTIGQLRVKQFVDTI